MSSRVPLAWKNLTHSPRRLAVAVGGIGFAVVLMFMQMGFKNALYDSTVQVLRELNADILLVGKAQYALPAQQRFSRARIYEAASCEGIESAFPLYIEVLGAIWRQPRGKGVPIRVLACDLSEPVFLGVNLDDYCGVLSEPSTALLDACSKHYLYGLPGSPQEIVGQEGYELSGQAIRIVGTFRMATDFANDGNLIMSTANFAHFFPRRAGDRDPLSIVDVGLVKVKPGSDVETVRRRLADKLPSDVTALSKEGLIDREVNFWARSTPVGFVFSLGTVIGFIVGVIICYQIIHSDIDDHLPEYATLKAMGYGPRYFLRVVVEEALYLSAMSFLPGLLVSLCLYSALAGWTGLLVQLTLPRALGILMLTIAMCVTSAALAMRKVISADPADLF